MIRRNRGRNAKVEAKKDVVKSRAISGKVLTVGILATIVAFVAFGELNSANGEDKSTVGNPALQQTIVHQYKLAGKYKNFAHMWAHKGGRGHKYHTPIGPMTNSLRAETRRKTIWKLRADHERRLYVAMLAENRKWKALNRSMWRAVDAAAREYGVSAGWLHACVSSEGGHNGWVMNHQGSGAGGWFQFMESTFYGNVGSARMYGGKERFPAEYAKWTSRVGQAYTAAYMFKIGQSRQWTGAGC